MSYGAAQSLLRLRLILLLKSILLLLTMLAAQGSCLVDSMSPLSYVMRVEQMPLRAKLKLRLLMSSSRAVLKLGWLTTEDPVKCLTAKLRCRGECLCRRRLAAARTLPVLVGMSNVSLTPLTLSCFLLAPAILVRRWTRLALLSL